MPNQTNYLIGYGEHLTESILAPPSGAPKLPPYTFAGAKERLTPMLQGVSQEFASLPEIVCPNDQAVAVLTLHPQYIAKSYFPGQLLRSVGVHPIGSRPSEVKPEKWTKKSEPKLTETTEIFIAGSRKVFREWANHLPTWVDNFSGADQIISVEQIRAQRPSDRIQSITSEADELMLEVVLHASPNSNYILEGFEAFLKSIGLKANFDHRFHVGGLCFLPLLAPRALISKTAEFSFLRVVREMPRLRMLNPFVRSIRSREVACSLPSAGVISPNTRVAIFDGGLPKDSPMTRWVLPIDPPDIGEPVPEFLDHGHQVTSALLFGSMKQDELPLPPFCGGEHYRVLDKDSATDPLELYDVLKRIRTILQNERYEFINLSIGPELTVEDKEVHGWTAFFDQHLSSGMTLATIAVGNGGENDRASGNARIQVPSGHCNQ